MRIWCFRTKAHLVSHWCFNNYNNIRYFFNCGFWGCWIFFWSFFFSHTHCGIILCGVVPDSYWNLLETVFLGLEVSKVNLCSRTEEQRRWQALSDKGDNNFVWNKFASNFTFLSTDVFVKDQKTSMLSEDHDRTLLLVIALSLCHTQAFC